MAVKGSKEKSTNSEKHNSDVKEWITRIGIVVLFIAFIVALFRFNIKFTTSPKPNAGITIPVLIWDSIMNLETGFVFIVDIIVSFLLEKYANNIRKSRIVIILQNLRF